MTSLGRAADDYASRDYDPSDNGVNWAIANDGFLTGAAHVLAEMEDILESLPTGSCTRATIEALKRHFFEEA